MQGLEISKGTRKILESKSKTGDFNRTEKIHERLYKEKTKSFSKEILSLKISQSQNRTTTKVNTVEVVNRVYEDAV